MAHRVGMLIVALLLFTAFAGSASANPPTGVPANPPEFVAGQVLVKFQPGAAADQIAEAHARIGGEVIETLPGIDVQVVRVPAGLEQARLAAYQHNPNVEFAELNGIWRVEWTPDDPRVGEQWQYHNTGQTGGTPDADIDAVEAWDVTRGSAQVRIAILDTGIDPHHNDLGGKVAATVNFTDSSTSDDVHGHGTHVAGSAAAATNNSIGVAGTCPDCVLYNVKVLGDGGGGSWDWVASGIRWATDNNAQVINMSLGGGASRTVELAVNRAWNNGVVIVAAAGNNGTSQKFYPAAYANVIAVAATDHHDSRASFSNWGSWVSVAAPGVSILSTTKGGGYAAWNGTSMASPHVAGIAGLVWSTDYGTSNSAVRSRVEQTSDQIAGTGSSWTHGRVNACKAVNGSCDVATSPPSVSIVNPVPDTTVSGDVIIQVNATDNEDSLGSLTTEVSINSGAWLPTLYNDGTGLYERLWETGQLSSGAYTITAKATDSDGNTSFAEKVVVIISGTVAIPGAFEAEDYRTGGQGIGYYDTTSGNFGGAYRNDDVDIEMCSDPTTPAGQSCYNVGWIERGEWLAHDVSVTEAAYYAFTVRVASVNTGTHLHIDLNGTGISGPITVPNTGGWQTWTSVTTGPISLPAGEHTLKLVASSTNATGYLFNLNYVTVDVATSPAPVTTMNASLSGTSKKQGARNWTATATTTVSDTNGSVVSSATVTGTWSNASTAVTCTTNSTGQCSITSSNVPNSTESVTFTVTNVTHETLTYSKPDPPVSITIKRP
jgi:thermitase